MDVVHELFSLSCLSRSRSSTPMIIRLILTAVVLAVMSAPSYAEPYLAIKEGVKCSGCHINPTGGGRRNVFGSAYGQTILSSKPATDIWLGDVTDRIKIGGDLRANIASSNIPNQPDVFAFEVEEALIYGQLELIKDKLSLYFDERIAPGGAFNREAYGLFWLKGRDYYAKAGRFFLPFGYRLEDDTSFVKQVTGINYDNPDTGVEFGADLDAVSVNLAITNGTAGFSEVDTGKQISLRSSYVQPNWRVGLSANFNDTDGSDRTIGGLFGGVRTGPVQWLGEMALISDNNSNGPSVDQLATFAEANVGFKKGHNLKFTYEYLDPNRDQGEDGQNRYSAVYEFFPVSFVQVTGGLRIGEGIPQSNPQNTDEAFLQMHLYF